MIPIKDELPTRRTPYVTLTLIVINVLVFAYQFLLDQKAEMFFSYEWGVVPAFLTGTAQVELPPDWPPRLLTLVTYQFLHGGFMHLAGNMLYLWIFGNNVEDTLGRFRFTVFYLLGGALAAGIQIVAGPSSDIPMIGASGAIAAVLGAYFVLHPRANVTVLIIFFFFVQLVKVPAVLVLGIWFLLQVLSVGAGDSGVAWMAHIGGFVIGLVGVRFFVPSPSRPSGGGFLH